MRKLAYCVLSIARCPRAKPSPIEPLAYRPQCGSANQGFRIRSKSANLLVGLKTRIAVSRAGATSKEASMNFIPIVESQTTYAFTPGLQGITWYPDRALHFFAMHM